MAVGLQKKTLMSLVIGPDGLGSGLGTTSMRCSLQMKKKGSVSARALSTFGARCERDFMLVSACQRNKQEGAR